MKLTTEKTGHHYLTPEGTVLNTKDGGKRDSLGRTARAMMVYDENREELLFAVFEYFRLGKCYRYHDRKELNSRDHAVISLSCLKEINWIRKQKINIITSPRFTFGQRIWVKAMFSRFWSIVYLIYKLPGLAVWYPLKNWVLRKASRTLKTYDSPAECRIAQLFKPPTKWQKFCFRLTLKTFASFYTLYEINAIESNWAKRILQRVMVLHFEESNYVARAMCGEKVSYPKNYVPSRSNRWSVFLNIVADNRDMTSYHDTEEDNLEVAMLKHYCK